MLTQENKYDVQKSAEILKASITATRIIAVRTRIDVMDGHDRSRQFIDALIMMEQHLDKVLKLCEGCL